MTNFNFIKFFLIRETTKNFNGSVWSTIGPHLVTRVIKNLCSISSFSSFKTTMCEKLNILPPSKCYAVGWEEWEKFFEPYQLRSVRRDTKNSYFVHLWNHFSDSRFTLKTEHNAMNEIASKHCPKIYGLSESFI